MRKQDLKIGEEYAVQVGRGLGRHAEPRRVKLLELDAERHRRTVFGGTVCEKGVLCELLAASYSRRQAGATEIVTTREIHCTWAEWEQRRAVRDDAEAARKKADAELIERCEGLRERAKALGIEIHWETGYVRPSSDFTLDADTLEKLLDLADQSAKEAG